MPTQHNTKDTTIEKPRTTHHKRVTTDDTTVHTTTRSDFDTSEEILTALSHQTCVNALDESNHCNSGDQGFRTYKSSLPVIQHSDIRTGLLVYRPAGTPLSVYEIRSEPYMNEHGFSKVDVIVHSRSHNGSDPDIRSRKDTVFTASIVDTMTVLQPRTIQETLA